jgi:hypothetical protein
MITKKDKEIIALRKEGKTVRQIAQLTRSSFGTIGIVLEKAEEEEKTFVQNKTMLEEDTQERARYTKAMEMFSRGKRNIDIAKEITGMRADEILSIQEDYWKLNDAEELARIYANSKSYLSFLLLLYSHMRQENIDKDDLVYALKNFKELRLLNEEIIAAIDHLEQLSNTRIKTQNDIHSSEHKMRLLERIIEKYENEISQYREKLKSFREFEAMTDELDKH